MKPKKIITYLDFALPNKYFEVNIKCLGIKMFNDKQFDVLFVFFIFKLNFKKKVLSSSKNITKNKINGFYHILVSIYN